MINLNIELVCLVKVESNVQVLYLKNVIIFRKLQKTNLAFVTLGHCMCLNLTCLFIISKCISLSMMLFIVGELKFAAWINQSPHFLYDPLLSVMTTGFKWMDRELIKQTWIILLWWRIKNSKLDSEVPWPEKLKVSNNYSVSIYTDQKWRGEGGMAMTLRWRSRITNNSLS